MSDCIVNVGFGHWHPKGSARLKNSLIHHGYPGHIQTWTDSLPPGSPTHEEIPYGMKVAAVEWAKNQGYTRVMWLDSSVWCIKYPKVHLEAMGREGYYLVESGFTCDVWTNDNCLKFFGLTREQASHIPMISAGIIGLSFDNPIAGFFFDRWKEAMEGGAFNGSWTATPEEGSGPAYRGHRHDQACASIIAHRLGMRLHTQQIYDYYYQPNMPETVEFALAGM